MTTLIESCRVAPPPGAVAEQSVPLTFFDLTWLFFHPISQVLFYEVPRSKPYLLETLVPQLKESLSLTLKHFFPLAGIILYPLNPDEKPVFRYRAGDSVSLTISESSDDFDNLVANHARDADNFYDFIPQMPPIMDESDHKLIPVLALQVTLFRGRGFCIGSTTHHSPADAVSFVAFMRSWAAINKFRGDDEFSIKQSGESLPVLDRSLITYPKELDSIKWERIRKIPLPSPASPLPTNRVRATYVMSLSEIKKLKHSVQMRNPGLARVSSFVVMAAYVWTCLVKSLRAEEEETKVDDDDDEVEIFFYGVDLRGRINPPVPRNYFGNYITHGMARICRHKLVGDEGFVLAAQAIAEDIKNRIIDNDKILEGAKNWSAEISTIAGKSVLGVSGSARFDLYSADFGWGKARKLEINSIDKEKYTMSMCAARDCEGGLEVGLSLPKEKMDAFAAHFSDGIKNL